MIDHLTIPIKSIEKAQAFYDKTLLLIGYERIVTLEIPEAQIAGYGKDGKPSFWIGEPKGDLPKNGKPFDSGFIRGLHFAFLAPSADSIDEWHKTCLSLGGRCNGKPGPRHYHEGYYGAFIIDPDGWKIEACLHDYLN